MDGNKTITANFTQITYTLTVNTSGQGAVTRNPNQASYPAGSTVTLTATTPPRDGASRGGRAAPRDQPNPLQVTMDGNKTITANFTQDNIYPDGKHQRTGQRDKKPQPGQLPCREHRDTHANTPPRDGASRGGRAAHRDQQTPCR
jgi:hypothetical protein